MYKCAGIFECVCSCSSWGMCDTGRLMPTGVRVMPAVGYVEWHALITCGRIEIRAARVSSPLIH